MKYITYLTTDKTDSRCDDLVTAFGVDSFSKITQIKHEVYRTEKVFQHWDKNTTY